MTKTKTKIRKNTTTKMMGAIKLIIPDIEGFLLTAFVNLLVILK